MRTSPAAALIGACALCGCHRAPDAATVGPDAGQVPVASASAAPTIAPPRCHATGQGAAIAEPEDLELGAATARADGYAVGLVHRTGAGRVAAVGLAGADLSLRVVDLGPTLGDAPPPHLAVRGAGLLAAAYGGAHADTRELRVYDVATSGDARLLGVVAEQRDDSLAFDVAPGLVVWDEATVGKSVHGVVRGATVSVDGRVGAAHDLSPPDSDAEAPRIVAGAADGKGYFVLWLARRPEVGATHVDAAPVPETVGEPRAYSWIEMAVVDGSGAPVGAARHLTSTSGHVSAYDVRAVSGEARPAVLVVARDLGEAVDGSGGALLRVRAREDGADPPLAFPTDGLGRGAPSFVDGPSPWLAWVDAHEAVQLLPLDGAGAPVAPPSLEPSLDDRSPLLELPSGAPGASDAGAARVLVAAPADSTAQLQVFACAR